MEVNLATGIHRCLVVMAASVLVACEQTSVPEEPVIDGIAFVAMTVSSVEKTAALLTDAVKLDQVVIADANSSKINIAADDAPKAVELLRGVNTQLLLLEYPQTTGSAAPVEGPGITHICFQVDEQTQTYQQLLAGGATVIGDPQLTQINPRRPVFYGYLHDRDGLVYEVEHVDVTALDLPEPPPHDYRIRQVALSTPNMDSLMQFYSVLFSEPEPRHIGRWLSLQGEAVDAVTGLAGAKLEMGWFQTRNLELEIVHYKNQKTEAAELPRQMKELGYSLIMFDVLDLNATAERLALAGADLVPAPGFLASSERIFARDPDGNLLGFQRIDAEAALSSQHFQGDGT